MVQNVFDLHVRFKHVKPECVYPCMEGGSCIKYEDQQFLAHMGILKDVI